MKVNPESLARASSRRPWTVIGVWILVLVVAGLLSSALLADALTTDFDFTDNPDSKRAEQLLEDRLRGPQTFSEIVVVSSTSLTADDPAYEAYIGELAETIESLGPDRIQAVFPVGQDGLPMVSADGRSQLVNVVLANTDLDEASDDAIDLEEAIAYRRR